MGIHIEEIDTRRAPEAVLEELASYYDVVQAEDMPDDPPTPREQTIHEWRSVMDHLPIKRWTLREDGDIVAVAVAVYDLEQNLENGFGRIHVHPLHRGRGHARRLATPLFDDLEAAGRHRFDTWVKDGEPAETLCKKLGLKAVYTDKRSRLQIDELDHGLMRSWIDRASERASDYEIRYYLSPVPDEIIDDMCKLADVMNTAPREEYQADDEVMTPENWREHERSVEVARGQLHTMIAVHRPSGQFVGYTQIKTQALHPDLAWQWDTGVSPDHRNKGLGRWLKAAMIERICAEYPEVSRVDTGNAASNEAMLSINVAMGFKPVHVSRAWQGDLATVRRRLRA